MNYSKDFTLTVKAVNDAPIVLHPLEELYQGVQLWCWVHFVIMWRGIMNYIKNFTLTVKAVNDAPIVLHPLEELYQGVQLWCWITYNQLIFNFFQNSSNCVCNSCIVSLFSIVVWARFCFSDSGICNAILFSIWSSGILFLIWIRLIRIDLWAVISRIELKKWV